MKRVFFAVLATTVFSIVALAGEADVWTETSLADFAGGELKEVSTTSTGKIVLSRATSAIQGLNVQFVWDLAMSDKGVLYAATGSPGAVHRIENGKVTMLFTSSEQHANSVTVDKAGNVYLGTAPRGMIYRISPDKKVSILADLPDNYVWDLAFNPKGMLIAATGPKGNLYEIDPKSGETKVLFHSNKSNLMCLLIADDGTIYTGSQPEGLLYRVTPEGKAFVILDAAEDEIHTLAFGPEGDVLAGTAAKSMPAQGGAPQAAQQSPGQPTPQQGGQSAQQARQQAQAAQQRAQAAQRPTGGVVTGLYRIKPNGDIDRLFMLQGAYVYSLATSGESVYVGTGTKGRIFELEKNGEHTLMADRREQQILSMLVDKQGRIVFGTGAPGRLFMLEDKLADSGEYISEVKDVGYLARWGWLDWQAETPAKTGLKLFVRSGNSPKPDQTWTEWMGPYGTASGQNVTLPVSQFVQYRAALQTKDPGSSPVLMEVSLAYAVQNRAPMIMSFNIDGQEAVASAQQRGGGGQRARRRPPQQGPQQGGPQRPGQQVPSELRRLAWVAGDPDGDTLVFRLDYKGENEKLWKPLEKRIVGQNQYAWDTSKVPDGRYLLRLTVSDEMNNPGNEVEKDRQVTEPFVVDNRRPLVKELQAKAEQGAKVFTISGTVEDETSPITSIRVSMDSGDWKPVFAADGILDSPKEKFQFETAELELEEHVFVFMAEDAAGNIGSAKIVVRPAETSQPGKGKPAAK